MHIDSIFNVLNTPEDKRLKNLDESLAAFPYVNGKLFEERLPTASFDSGMRKILKDCCLLDWGKISPAIFGSLFQSVMDEKARRNLGAHYTSEKNILKLIKPLFLDELWAEFNKTQSSKAQLQKLHDKISSLRFLDPACGCGNFLIIAYRELRLLEIEIIKKLLKLQGYREEVIKGAKMNAAYLIKCNVDQFYGIEYEEFPSQIARTAMWLMDHQMNMQVTETFGEYYVRLPLQKAATIVQGNALRIDWQSLLQKDSTVTIHAGTANVFEVSEPVVEYETVNVYAKNVNVNPEVAKPDTFLKYDYIFSNPPFVGGKFQNAAQKADMDLVFMRVNGAGVLDYVTAWYILAAKYLQGKITKAAFVSTNSISQGEQVGILWNELFNKHKIKIHFAHQTFKWGNEAKGNAGVHVVIIGFASFDITEKRIFEYEDIKDEPHETKAKNVNPYLVEGKDILITKRSNSISNAPEIKFGNQPIDGGYLLLSKEEFDEFIKKEPQSKKYLRKYYGSDEFINNIERYCLWLKDSNPSELKNSNFILDRLDKVRQFRLESKRKETRELAAMPARFAFMSHTETPYVIIPSVSSERRNYIPIGFMDKDTIASNLCLIIPNASIYHFGVLESKIHMAWVKYVCGRLESRYRYSNTIVYNNFPWPENPTDKQKEAVEKAAQAVLDARTQFPDSSLADMYDPNTMPPVLVKAHQQLDRAVDLCYRPQPFINETKRIEYLFELYDKYTAGLFVKEKKSKKIIPRDS